MPSKLQIIKEMAAREALSITSNTERFMAFLHTAANNYKYDFKEQLLIHAQKPDATACAEIDTWNKLGRWVNAGTRGIALLVDRDVPYKLRYVFDLSDTNSRAGREVNLWQLQDRYLDDVKEALNNSFGEATDTGDFRSFLMQIAEYAVNDNLDDYVATLTAVKGNSLLEELDELNTKQWLRQTLISSVGYMLMTRCGLDANKLYTFEDFAHVLDFNTHETIGVLGVAASDISEMVLREIEVTVRAIQREEKSNARTFANREENRYHEGRKTKTERRTDHETDLYNAGRLSAPEPGSTGGTESGQVWNAAAQLPAEPQESTVHRDDVGGQAERTSGGSGPAGQRNAGEPAAEVVQGTGRDGGAESEGSDVVGPADEQPPASSRGDSSGGSGLQLSGRNGNFVHDIEYFHQDPEKNELLRTCEKLRNHRVEIAAFFASNPDTEERGNFIKGFFDNTFIEQILSNGQRAGYRAYDDMFHMWRGSYPSREREVYYRWSTVARHIEGMLLLDTWLAPDEVFLPTEEMQKAKILRGEFKDGTGFDFPQAAIDYVICYGSSYENGKLAIYEQFMQNKTAKENIEFLKKAYGWGGHSDAIPGSGLWENHDGKGISVSRYDSETQDTAEVLLTWPMVEKRIRELIAADRYLTPKQKAAYKNLAAYSKMRNVGGISQTEAQKSSDLYMKCRYLDEITGGRGIIFATGTPISNSMVEMYTMQKYLQYNTLKENDLLHFDAWASNFGETVTAIELAPEGSGYRAKTRFSRFYNLPELMAMFKEVADIQTGDMLKLPTPTPIPHPVVLKPSEQQKEMVAALSERAEKVRNKMVDSSVDNMLLITNDGRKLALDQRLMSPMLGDSETSKATACADAVYDIWLKHTDTLSTQFVFCDLSTPHNDGTFNVYDDVRDKLIAKGIPADQIAYIHNANTEAQKKELFGKVRSGQVRVLLGSTQKMGAGTNVQQRLIALHHLDCPWRPSDLQQREGRIVRQGNMHDEVDIYTYVTENTFDSYLYQLVESKQKFIGQIMTSKSPVRSAEDIDETALSYAEIKALCTGNPYIKEKMDLDIDVQRLRLMKASHLSQRYALEDKIIKEFPQQIASFEQMIAGLKADMARVKEHTHPNEDGFSPMVIENVCHSSKKAAGSAILEVCSNMTSPDPIPLGMYRGFSLKLHFDSMKREFVITMQGELSYPVTLGTDIFGNIQRLDNAIDTFPERLARCEAQLDNVHQQLEAAKIEAEAPFPQEDELKKKSARLDELNILLNLDKKENEIVDGDRADDDGDRPATDRGAR